MSAFSATTIKCDHRGCNRTSTVSGSNPAAARVWLSEQGWTVDVSRLAPFDYCPMHAEKSSRVIDNPQATGDPIVIHLIEPGGGLTNCCGKTVFELDRNEQVTVVGSFVKHTCGVL